MSTKLLPSIAQLTPTSFDAYVECPRRFFLNSVLALPASDPSGFGETGMFVHSLLRFIHTQGSCHDAGHVRDALIANGADDPHIRGLVERHSARCPIDTEGAAHEVDRARFHKSAPLFMATARIDAVWIHDGLLDARDYKTGGKWHDRLAEDNRAKLQAWILQRDAQRKGLRLQLRYEYLSAEVDDDPEPWEPDADDLEAIERELCVVVNAMRAQDTWAGVADDRCTRCAYRSICRDSAAPSEPTWPVLTTADEVPG
jgi:hypothetical protein